MLYYVLDGGIFFKTKLSPEEDRFGIIVQELRFYSRHLRFIDMLCLDHR